MRHVSRNLQSFSWQNFFGFQDSDQIHRTLSTRSKTYWQKEIFTTCRIEQSSLFVLESSPESINLTSSIRRQFCWAIIARQYIDTRWFFRVHLQHLERFRDAFHYHKWIDPKRKKRQEGQTISVLHSPEPCGYSTKIGQKSNTIWTKTQNRTVHTHLECSSHYSILVQFEVCPKKKIAILSNSIACNYSFKRVTSDLDIWNGIHANWRRIPLQNVPTTQVSSRITCGEFETRLELCICYVNRTPCHIACTDAHNVSAHHIAFFLCTTFVAQIIWILWPKNSCCHLSCAMSHTVHKYTEHFVFYSSHLSSVSKGWSRPESHAQIHENPEVTVSRIQNFAQVMSPTRLSTTRPCLSRRLRFLLKKVRW